MFQFLIQQSALQALQMMLGQSVSKIYIDCHDAEWAAECQRRYPKPIQYPHDESLHDKDDNFAVADPHWCFPCTEKQLHIMTDWGDVEELDDWPDFYTFECNWQHTSTPEWQVLCIQFAAEYVLDCIERIELYAYQMGIDDALFVSDRAIKLIAKNGLSILLATCYKITGYSKIIMQPERQAYYLRSISGFKRVVITPQGIETLPLPSLEEHDYQRECDCYYRKY